MEREYVISNRSKITYYIISVIFLGMALLMIFVAHKDSETKPLYFMGFLFTLLPAMLLVNALRKKVTVNDYSVKFAGPLATKELPIKDIKGYRIIVNKSAKSVIFETNNGTGKFTLSSITELGDSEELLNWVQTNFTDLDAVDMQQEKDALLENSAFGTTSEEREASLKKAKNLTYAFAIGAGIVGFFTIFYDSKIWAVIDVLYPFIGVLLIVTSKGLIRFITNNKRSIYPHIFIGMIIICMICFAKGLASSDLYDATNMWKPAVLLTAIMAAAIFFSNRDKSMPMFGQVLLSLVISIFCGFGNTLHINKVFDTSATQTYRVIVVNKTISSGKSTSYYLHTSFWGPEEKSVSASVGRTMYDNTNIGDTITIYFNKGALNIPHYQVGR